METFRWACERQRAVFSRRVKLVSFPLKSTKIDWGRSCPNNLSGQRLRKKAAILHISIKPATHYIPNSVSHFTPKSATIGYPGMQAQSLGLSRPSGKELVKGAER